MAELILTVILKLWVCRPDFSAYTVAICPAAALEFTVVTTLSLITADEWAVCIELNAATQTKYD